MNIFAISVATLQFCAAAQYLLQGKPLFGALWLTYAFANCILIAMAR